MFLSRFLQWRRIREQELEEEILVHLRMAAKDRIDTGESSQDATAIREARTRKHRAGEGGYARDVGLDVT